MWRVLIENRVGLKIFPQIKQIIVNLATMIILHSQPDEETYPIDRCAPLFEATQTTERDDQLRSKKDFDADVSLSKLGSSTRKRRVRFVENAETYEIPHFSTYTPSEKSRCWNNTEDFARIHARNHRLVAKALKGETIDQDKDTLRGLENFLKGSKASRRYQEFVVVVLETQDELWYEEDYFEELSQTIAALGGAISHESALEAARIGRQDEEDAT